MAIILMLEEQAFLNCVSVRCHRRFAKYMMQPIAAHVVWSVCLSVCLLDTSVSRAETAEPIKVSFSMCRKQCVRWRYILTPASEYD